MRQNLFLRIVIAFLLFTHFTNVFAEEIRLPSAEYLLIVPPTGWKKKEVPTRMEATQVVWRKPGPKDIAFMLVKAAEKHPTEGFKYTNTEEYANALLYSYLKQNTRVIQKPTEVEINNIKWMKIISENERADGFILRTDTYCLFKDDVGIQIRIMGDKNYWAEIAKETAGSLKSIKIK